MKIFTVKRLVLDSILLSLLIISAYISLPIGNVNVTLQVFMVFMIILLCKHFDSIIILTIYAIMGSIGLPVFSGFNAGSFSSPTYGFILGFIFCSILISFYSVIFNKNINLKFDLINKAVICLLGIYIIGIPYSSFILKNNIFFMFVYFLPYILLDTVKVFIACIMYKKIKKIIE